MNEYQKTFELLIFAKKIKIHKHFVYAIKSLIFNITPLNNEYCPTDYIKDDKYIFKFNDKNYFIKGMLFDVLTKYDIKDAEIISDSIFDLLDYSNRPLLIKKLDVLMKKVLSIYDIMCEELKNNNLNYFFDNIKIMDINLFLDDYGIIFPIYDKYIESDIIANYTYNDDGLLLKALNNNDIYKKLILNIQKAFISNNPIVFYEEIDNLEKIWKNTLKYIKN